MYQGKINEGLIIRSSINGYKLPLKDVVCLSPGLPKAATKSLTLQAVRGFSWLPPPLPLALRGLAFRLLDLRAGYILSWATSKCPESSHSFSARLFCLFSRAMAFCSPAVCCVVFATFSCFSLELVPFSGELTTDTFGMQPKEGAPH